MTVFRKNWLKSALAMALLCVMALKMGAALLNRFSANTESFSIEKNAEEGKDVKEEYFGKGDKKLLFTAHYTIDHIHYWISNVTPVCRYKMQEVTDPPKTVPTPPPDFSLRAMAA